MTEATHDEIQKCAEKLREAIEKLGGTGVSVLYVYTAIDADDNHYVNSGFASEGLIQAIGCAEFVKHQLL